MKIIHNKSQKAYQLNSDTQIEIEKPNLFFNEYGEQSLPLDLPDTDLNRQLTGYPDLLANRNKQAAEISCTLIDGGYMMACRQAVLSAQRGKSISTSFYMNDGAFLSRMKNISLMEIFGDETVPGITTVEEGIQFCRSLLDGSNENFAIFPIRIEMDDMKKEVNQVESYRNGPYNFVNEKEQTETVDGNTIVLSPGYYMSPFIRGSYLLKRLFEYFGYTMEESAITSDATFKNIVFINNTMDSLANGMIKLSHLVPDCMCNDVLDVYRKKFCCEFVPDEGARSVRVVFFKDIINETDVPDLTPYLVGHPEISYPDYKQLRLISDEFITDGSDTYESTSAIQSKYPNAWYDPTSNSYKRTGYHKFEFDIEVSDGHLPYWGGGTLEAYEVSVPDAVYCITAGTVESTESGRPSGSRPSTSRPTSMPFIGAGRALNSTVIGIDIPDGDETKREYIATANHDQKCILSFFKPSILNDDKTIRTAPEGSLTDGNGERSFSLLYNGPSGLYERFYREYDNLLRNSMHEVKADFLFPDVIKQTLQAHRKVIVDGQACFFDVMKYNLGVRNEVMSSDMFTASLYEPLNVAMNESERLKKDRTGYRWKVITSEREIISEESYLEAGKPAYDIKLQRYEENLDPIYPPLATEAQYKEGGAYYSRYCYGYSTSRDTGKYFYRYKIYLVVERINSVL